MSEWKVREVKMEIKKGVKNGCWLVKIGVKKFVLSEVKVFWGEGEKEKEKDEVSEVFGE